jgi:hypothetical protein
MIAQVASNLTQGAVMSDFDAAGEAADEDPNDYGSPVRDPDSIKLFVGQVRTLRE